MKPKRSNYWGQGEMEVNRKWSLSKIREVFFTLDGVCIIEEGQPLFYLSHNELRTLNKLRKKYNYEARDDLMIIREEANDE